MTGPDSSRLIGELPKWMAASLEEGSASTYRRTDALRVLLYPITLLGTLLPALVWRKAPEWMLIGDAAILAMFLALYAGAYVFCLWKRPDSLRSEKFELAKYAIEQTLRGDSQSGLLEVPVRDLLEAVAKDPIVDMTEAAR